MIAVNVHTPGRRLQWSPSRSPSWMTDPGCHPIRNPEHGGSTPETSTSFGNQPPAISPRRKRFCSSVRGALNWPPSLVLGLGAIAAITPVQRCARGSPDVFTSSFADKRASAFPTLLPATVSLTRHGHRRRFLIRSAFAGQSVPPQSGGPLWLGFVSRKKDSAFRTQLLPTPRNLFLVLSCHPQLDLSRPMPILVAIVAHGPRPWPAPRL